MAADRMAEDREGADHGATRALAPAHAPPVAGTQTERQFLHRQRLMVFLSAQKTGRAPGCGAGPGRKRSRARRPYRSRRLDAHDILESQRLQLFTKTVIISIGSIGQYHATRYALLQQRANLCQRYLRLDLELDIFRHTCFSAPLRVMGPDLGQI